MRSPFLEQSALMLRVMPYVAEEDRFALKGGTAINFFLRDMPRLSVDIDLTYLPVEPRDESLTRIGQALDRIKSRISTAVPGVAVREGRYEGKPDWRLLGLDGADKLSAVQWKLKNIAKMGGHKHKEQLAALKRKLGL